MAALDKDDVKKVVLAYSGGAHDGVKLSRPRYEEEDWEYDEIFLQSATPHPQGSSWLAFAHTCHAACCETSSIAAGILT